MQTGGALLLAAFLGLYAWAWWGRGVLGRRRSTRLFSSLLQNASVNTESASITGSYEGSELTVRFAKRKAPWSRSNTAATDCTEVVLSGFPQELQLSLSHRSGNAYRIGWTATCDTGDTAFDRSFWVEGAPVPWIVAMLTADVRARLLVDRFVQVAVEDQSLVFAHFGFFSDPNAAKSILSLALALRAKALELRAQTIETKVQQAATSGYRGDAEQAAAHALDSEKQQAAVFAHDRDARLASARRTMRVVQVVLVLGIAAFWAYWWRGHH